VLVRGWFDEIEGYFVCCGDLWDPDGHFCYGPVRETKQGAIKAWNEGAKK